ncbi:DddA-like double-stranded DNA deaminase toxin [Streptomyces sp. NPDC093085]|uniref:DddA-like double-stranded DNA deaminase toxin n=1 Tax=Streptomyces sp. NPDC093085 TaxID=3155068 RepID=UPI003418A768
MCWRGRRRSWPTTPVRNSVSSACRNHVEMQVAAYMRRNDIGRGVLYINRPDGVCQFCNGSACASPGGTPVNPI